VDGKSVADCLQPAKEHSGRGVEPGPYRPLRLRLWAGLHAVSVTHALRPAPRAFGLWLRPSDL